MKKRLAFYYIYFTVLLVACSNTSIMIQNKRINGRRKPGPKSGGSITLATTSTLNLDPLKKMMMKQSQSKPYI